MITEIWKPIPNYEGLYEVSNTGKVKSLRRVIKRNHSDYTVKERVLKSYSNDKDYICVNLSKNGNGRTWKVHQLIAMAFLNHKPNGSKIVVDHIDNDRSNNSLENIQVIPARLNTSKDRKGYSSKYVGVCWCNTHKKWMACIQIDGKNKTLGYFTDEYEAHLAYESKRLEYDR